MILLFSRLDDGNTHLVIEWLLHMKKAFIRINADDKKTKIKRIDGNEESIIVEQNGKEYDLLKCRSVWYRRRGISLGCTGVNTDDLDTSIFLDAPLYHNGHLERETSTLGFYMYSQLENKIPNSIGNPYKMNLNKLRVLEIAKASGLLVPQTYVLTSKRDLQTLLVEKKLSLITKAISDGVYLFTDQNGYYSYTEKIDISDLNKIPETFYPSLFQVQIKKKLELRVFYIKEIFYAMAIFSQSDTQTAVDFRKYNNNRPNRTEPYELPEHIKSKLKEMLKKLELNTGSIDIIVDENNQYIFLEINPVGQITMTSKPCNYYLEKKIAEIL
ncbi:grasp-with-spasm system ATP-grasp peptide maturase [uncultured Sphingobacterium sp.]|uniref:grasp-with-spasm system ATP-grasp peptide maturase n=1 Tax=uncultured Sphingobacterium sp. TaxID=182688 RepID=UPI003747B24B